MCIIAIKNKGINTMEKATLQRMFTQNPHGAGFAIHKDGQKMVTIQKGFMTYKAFEKALYKAIGTTPLENIALMLHFRITTHGGTSQENTHPFPLADVSIQKRLYHRVPLAICMNGICNVDMSYTAKHSDTMEYIAENMHLHFAINPKFYTIPDYLDNLQDISGAKWGFLDNKGNTYTSGGFHTNHSTKWQYSNTTYEEPRYTSYSYGWADYDQWDTMGGEWMKNPTTNKLEWVGQGLDDTLFCNFDGFVQYNEKGAICDSSHHTNPLYLNQNDKLFYYGHNNEPIEVKYYKLYDRNKCECDFEGWWCI